MGAAGPSAGAALNLQSSLQSGPEPTATAADMQQKLCMSSLLRG